MNRIDYYRAVLLGIVIGASFISIFHLIFFIENVEKPSKPQSNFEVVARYQNRCDTVRWTNGQFATYKYFLNCEK